MNWKSRFVIAAFFTTMFYIPNAHATSIVDETPPIMKPIEGPRTFKLLASGQELHILTLKVFEKTKLIAIDGVGTLIQEPSGNDVLKCSIDEAGKTWGSAKKVSNKGYSFDLRTDEHKNCLLQVTLDKHNQIKSWNVYIESTGSVRSLR